MRIKRGTLLIALLLGLGTALAMAVSGQEHDPSEVVGAVEKDSSIHHGEANQGDDRDDARSGLSAIKRTAPKKITSTALLDSRNWQAPPPVVAVKPAAALPPSPPTAPSLPFTYIGRMIDGNDVVLFLSRNGKQYVVKVNDVLDDNSYRVDKIADDSAVLTYLPMNEQQTLTFRSVSAAGVPAVSASAGPTAIQPLVQPQPIAQVPQMPQVPPTFLQPQPNAVQPAAFTR